MNNHNVLFTFDAVEAISSERSIPDGPAPTTITFLSLKMLGSR